MRYPLNEEIREPYLTIFNAAAEKLEAELYALAPDWDGVTDLSNDPLNEVRRIYSAWITAKNTLNGTQNELNVQIIRE